MYYVYAVYVSFISSSSRKKWMEKLDKNKHLIRYCCAGRGSWRARENEKNSAGFAYLKQLVKACIKYSQCGLNSSKVNNSLKEPPLSTIPTYPFKFKQRSLDYLPTLPLSMKINYLNSFLSISITCSLQVRPIDRGQYQVLAFIGHVLAITDSFHFG